MNKLFIAGDSFASLAKEQPIGNSWSEILASNLNLELCNIARPASSNFMIALQVEWISERVTPDDIIVIYLTDHYRKTLVDLNVDRDQSKHILETQDLHKAQRDSKLLNYSTNPRILNSIMDHSGRTKEYYRDWFDIEIQQIEDRLILTGALTKLSSITDKFVVCRGGYGIHRNNQNTDSVDHTTFAINSKQYLYCSSDYLTSLSERSSYINHLDDLTHKKFAILLNNIIKDRSS
jgi:hypothetical protein